MTNLSTIPRIPLITVITIAIRILIRLDQKLVFGFMMKLSKSFNPRMIAKLTIRIETESDNVFK